MSGHSDSETCCCCGADMNTYYDWKPHQYVYGQCLECGFSYYTEDRLMPLDEVNSLREDMELPPLTALRGNLRATAERLGIQLDETNKHGDADRGNGPGED
jgi:hypothetical protein